MYEFHNDKPTYFQYQYLTSKGYIVPFVEEHLPKERKLNVLEIGCAEAGVLKAFTELGHQCVGIELMQGRIELAKKFMSDELKAGQIKFINKNIYDIDVDKDLGVQFDLIILKDVIEHIPNQEVFMKKLLDFLAPEGKVFFGFPPWYMPFGGHQQICTNKILAKLPYYHLLPMGLYKQVLKTGGESEKTIANLVEIKETGISIERFEKIAKQNYSILKQNLFLVNPIYQYKFGLKPRNQAGVIAAIPYVKDFFSTCAYYLITPLS